MMAGQSIGDRLSAAKYSIAGQGLAKSVCKATTEEVIGPKKKHLDYLLHCTNEPNVSIPQLANLLVERTIHSSWVVVFKALVTVHHLMCYGNERFTQYLASSNSTFQLGSFLDKTNVQGYDMSTFIRRYAKYLNEKALSYRTVAFDFCKVKRGKEDGTLRTMNAEKLLKTVPVLQSQIDALLEFDCTANELSNGVINAAFMLLFRDLIRLFACYNDGIINLLEKYFDMNKKMCRDALDIYKKFLIRMDRVAEFLKVAEKLGLNDAELTNVTENVGIDKGDIPDLAKAPSSLLDALEQHLAALEGKKGSGAGTPTQPTVKPAYLNAVTALSSTSSSFGSAAAASGRSEMNGSTEDTLKKIALEEEQAVLNQHRFMLNSSAGNEGFRQNDLERRMKELGESPTSFPAGSTATNPFLSSPTAQEPTIDIFEALPASLPHTSSKASDDLLNLSNASNPFVDSIMNSSQPTATTQFQNDFWGNQNGFSSTSGGTTAVSTNLFASETSFAAVFGESSTINASTAGPTLTPTPAPEITVDQELGRSDLDIPGLNPFANISSATPSPSGAPEVRGAGTTPILGGHDSHMFGGPFGEGGIEPQKTGDEPDAFGTKLGDARSPAVPPPPSSVGGGAANLFPDFDSGFGSHVRSSGPPPRPPSPAVHVATAVSAKPAAPQPDLFGDFGGDFGLSQPSSNPPPSQPVPIQPQPPVPFSGFDFGGGVSLGLRTSAAPSPSVSGVSSPARAAPAASALDDLNATIRAAMSGSPSRNASTAGTPSAASDGGKSEHGFDMLGDVLQPANTGSQGPNQTGQSKSAAPGARVITGDLDSSLSLLAQNLDINRGVASSMQNRGGHVWNSPKNTAKTGGANWTPHIASSTAAGWNSPQHGFKPMGAMTGANPTAGKPADWSGGMMGGAFPSTGAPMGQQPQPFMAGARPAAPVMGMGMGMPGAMGMPGMVPATGAPQPMFNAMQPRPPAAFGAPMGTQPSQQPPTLDPFGAL